MGDPITLGLLAGSGVLKTFSSIQQGYAQKASLETQARQADIQAKQVEANAAIEEAERKRKLQEIISTQNALFGASNIDVTTGTPFSLAQASRAEEARVSGIAQTQADINKAIFEQQASSARGAKGSVMKGAVVGGFGDLLGSASQVAMIGKTPMNKQGKVK